jgi:hypothetical protein
MDIVTFFTNFSQLCRLFRELPQKFMSCSPPYYAVGVPADVSTVVGISAISGISAIASLPSAVDVCDVPIVSAAVAKVLVVSCCCCC